MNCLQIFRLVLFIPLFVFLKTTLELQICSFHFHINIIFLKNCGEILKNATKTLQICHVIVSFLSLCKTCFLS